MPSGWLEDEPPMVNDPNSVMPDDWDEDMDGKIFSRASTFSLSRVLEFSV